MRDYHEYFEKQVWAEPCSSVAVKIIRLTEACIALFALIPLMTQHVYKKNVSNVTQIFIVSDESQLVMIPHLSFTLAFETLNFLLLARKY